MNSNSGDGVATSTNEAGGLGEPLSAEIGSEVGQQAPNFSVTTIDGTRVGLDTYDGSPVLLYFYAVW